MAYRNRTKFEGLTPAGVARYYVGGVLPDDVQTPENLYTVSCYDTADGNWVTTNDLDLIRSSTFMGLVDGNNGSWICEKYAQKGLHVTMTNPPGWPTVEQAATTALARANPSRPNVDVWAFLAELRDLPKMVFQVGNYLRKVQSGRPPSREDVASGYLGWTFGWAPLISDLGKLLDFQSAVDKRVKALEKLNSGELRRTVTVFDAARDGGYTDLYVGPLYSATVRFRVFYRNHSKCWVRVRYVPTHALPPNGSGEQQDLARSLVFGHNISHETLWNLMPWSWLIDWFSNAGEFIAAHNNRLGLKPSDIAVMRQHTQYVDSTQHLSGPPGMVFTKTDGFTWQRKLRYRYVGGPSLSFHIPFLDMGQLSILSALAITRLK
ncbi:MAG: putative maturation protein [Gulmivirus nemorisadaptatum]|uniref:Maturation protein n=1 Tax=Leviviridae sp. TaxID=2027243 RepID=A0ABY3ST70_9VIRU|nr:MAG: putative maturation protein [Leviviridae sp.]